MIINKLKNWLVVTLSVCVFALIGVAFANVTPAPTATADTREVVQTWNISKTDADSVTATLYKNATDNTKYDLVISGAGAMADYGAETVPWFTVGDEAVDVRKQIVSVEMQEGLTNIGKYAFNQLTALANAKIPSTVTEIKTKAFYACGLTEFTVPANVKTIYSESFSGNATYHLSEITFEGLTTKVYSNSEKAVHTDTHIYCYSNSAIAEWANSVGRTNVTYLDVISLFKKVNVSLGADLTVNYQVSLTEEQAATAKMDFTINTYSVSDDSATLVGEGLYEFSFTGVAPQWIGDSITAVLTAGETEETKNYSVLQYCNAILDSNAETLKISDAKFNALKTLVADLVAYGAAAQTYTGDTDEQVSVDATGSTFATLTETDEEKTGSLDGVTFVGANLVFNKANALQFYFTAENANLNVLLTKNGVPVMVKKLSDLEKSGEQYVVTTEDIYATELDDIYTLTVYGEDMTQGASITYSVQSYVYANQANEADANLAALVKALWVYGESAKAYNKAA